MLYANAWYKVRNIKGKSVRFLGMLMFEKVYIFMTVTIADQIQTLENRIF